MHASNHQKKALIDQGFADKKNSVFRKKFEKRSSFIWYARLDSNQRPLESEFPDLQQNFTYILILNYYLSNLCIYGL